MNSEKVINCDEEGCKYKSRSEAKIDAHKVRAHSEAEKIKCDVEECEEECEPKDLEYHQALAHGIKTSLFVCGHEGCDYSDKRSVYMRYHRAYEHGDYSARCEDCCVATNEIVGIIVDKHLRRVCNSCNDARELAAQEKAEAAREQEEAVPEAEPVPADDEAQEKAVEEEESEKNLEKEEIPMPPHILSKLGLDSPAPEEPKE